MYHHDPMERADDPPKDEQPEFRCDLHWSPQCDNVGAVFLDPEYACAACAELARLEERAS